jgi:hypothetical protein
MKSFAEPTEREMLALAISRKEEDGRFYRDFALGQLAGRRTASSSQKKSLESEAGEDDGTNERKQLPTTTGRKNAPKHRKG